MHKNRNLTLQPIDTPTHPKKRWFVRHKKLTIILAIVVVLLVASATAAALYIFNQKPATVPAKTVHQTTKPTPPPPAPKYYSSLTGVVVADQAATTATVTGAMIENSPDARPQSGLKNSGMVFEAIAEGGITRFMVLYQQEKPQTIGPVRSVRLYDLNWLKPFNAGIAHVGGSAAALAEVRNGSYRDLDQFFNSAFYVRTTDRYAPHNVYTSFAKLDALNAKKGYTSSTFTGLDRKDSTAVQTPSATKINVTISSALYNSSYTYNAATNSYDRSQAGKPHLDREDGQISPRVVIVMKVNEATVMQDGKREQITTVGSGQAYIFQDGAEQDVTWHKDSNEGQLYFTDAAGTRVALARGQTWIAAVPGNEGGSVTWQ
jgi:hypothetical protein